MPITNTPDHDLRVLHTVSEGIILLDEIAHYQFTAWLDPALYGYNELYDCANSDYSKVSFSDLISIAQTASKLYMLDPNSKFAILTHTDHHKELASFYVAAKQIATGPSRDIKQFSSRDEAMQWLSVKA